MSTEGMVCTNGMQEQCVIALKNEPEKLNHAKILIDAITRGRACVAAAPMASGSGQG